MSSSRWQEVKSIVDAALERDESERARFLEEACRDPDLRREVESLLGFQSTGFLERSPVEPALESERDDPSGALVGQMLSNYKVLSELSRGGMGIVYRALDVKLKREVAIKVLPPHLMANQERKRRFIREAQAAAALEHPHIGVIYEIDDVGDLTFIVMELIQGEKLSDLLSRERLGAKRSLRLITEIAEGLSRAHERGIVHRDVKPGNVMITKDGHAKIIDFGLAKLVEPSGARDTAAFTATAARTDPGVVVGTVSYMSPEQARGEAVDHRSDIFSLGILLYEMLTGKLPFRGPSGAETLNAIINTPAPPIEASVEYPPRLQRILDRCLAKRPEERYAHMAPLVSDLRAAEWDARRPSDRFRIVPRSIRLTAAIVAVAVVVGIGVTAYLSRDRPRPELSQPVQVTLALGVEDYPAWSPDGRFLAYASSESGVFRGGNWDIEIAQLGSGAPLNRTRDYDGVDSYPSWSPDGSQIAFHSGRDGGGVFLMSPLGGTPRRIVPPERSQHAEFSSAPCWSRHGTELAFIDHTELEVLTLATGAFRRFSLPGSSATRYDPSWSPDEKLIAYVAAQNRTATVTQLWVLRLADGEALPLTDGKSKVWSPGWSLDGRSMYFVSDRGGAMDLWQLAVAPDGRPRGEPRALTVGVGMRRAALSADGTRLAYSDGGRIANLWRVPIFEDRAATWSDAEQLTFDQSLITFVEVSPDGRRLAFNSRRAGNTDLWVLPAGGGEMQQLTTDPSPDWSPSWSPDGKQIAFYSLRSGTRHLWVLPVAGGEARQLTNSDFEDYSPRWSPDGSSIVFFSLRSGNMDIWVIPAEGGEARQFTDDPHGDFSPQWSPDGQRLVWVSTRDSEVPKLWRIAVDGGVAERLTRGPAWYPIYSQDGSHVYFTGYGERAGNLWEVPAEGGPERPVTDLRGKRGSLGSESLTTDGEHLYFAWEEDIGDIWVMDVSER
ncbi:MAG TPA: protein kinase [Vicinamibacteria bacterium]|nr:protein kinase [Vicinamibacteria bacterium]